MRWFIFTLVSPIANLSEAAINQTYEIGDTATLECSSIGGPGNIHLWQFDGRNINGENSSILSIPVTTVSVGGLYSCVVSNDAGNDSASTLLFISPYFIKQPEEVVLTSAGSSINITCVAVAFPEPEYRWGHEDGRELRMDILTNSSFLTISNVQFGDEGNYYCNATSNGFLNMSLNALVIGELVVIV